MVLKTALPQKGTWPTLSIIQRAFFSVTQFYATIRKPTPSLFALKNPERIPKSTLRHPAKRQGLAQG